MSRPTAPISSSVRCCRVSPSAPITQWRAWSSSMPTEKRGYSATKDHPLDATHLALYPPQPSQQLVLGGAVSALLGRHDIHCGIPPPGITELWPRYSRKSVRGSRTPS